MTQRIRPYLEKAFGVDSARVDAPDDLPAALRQAFEANRPYLLEVRTRGDVPMAQRAEALADLAKLKNGSALETLLGVLAPVAKSGSGRSGVTYEATEVGRDVCDRFADVRAELLVQSIARA